jgi:hypothetical protein
VDEFKDVGRYFDGVGDSAAMTGPPGGRTITVEGWFIWLLGGASLLRDATPDPGGWSLGYDEGGRLAYRAAGCSRTTETPVDALRAGWHHYVLAKGGSGVTYYLDARPIDRWKGAPDVNPVNPWTAMHDGENFIEGYAADVAFYERPMRAERVELHWQLGRQRV